ncbi:class III lanthionine synthetase LanKC N-terminal domain-containing protein [Chitinophaga japonensis]|uniref:Protein kinase-like protein n=1 Tax=Chitinophaga japonensis TaxID=104662 RepID=A0A562SZZ8_CHIJA|nr:lanthionine synthetase LanC family protein [Chitinophaga japonensis]TWI86683.1 protein kinase-like protein [Chitinophaga japonensis]
MLPQKEMDTAQDRRTALKSSLQGITDYAALLDSYGLSWKASGHYLQVGEITQVQGWILHISVVRMQAPDLFEVLIPVLQAADIPFKIPVDKNTCDGLLGGACGYNNLAKVVCIYPDCDSKALRIAMDLILLTKPFKGPEIPTDIHLGGQVYTRYGGFNPVWKPGEDGNMHKFIYDQQGRLVEDTCPVPFILPPGLTWPFTAICGPTAPPRKKFLNDRIAPLAVIKADVKGNVIKGRYMQSWFRAKLCVVKEGKRCMFMDEWGRDMYDRLHWQAQLHKELGTALPVPRILDCFEENGGLYLATEMIDGISLDIKIYSLYEGHSWIDLPVERRLQLLDYLLGVTQILQGFHDRGYVFRDISPHNFLIDRKDRMYIIDLELAYSFAMQKPDPFFTGGSEGYMSPEQIQNHTPAVKQDIYGLGALMLLFFTNLSPMKFETGDQSALQQQLSYFVPESSILQLVTDCMHPNAALRPELPIIQKEISQYRDHLRHGTQPVHLSQSGNNETESTDAVYSALKGLCSSRMTYNYLWFSKTVQQPDITNQQHSVSLYPGLYEGIGGVLWMLAMLESSGFPVAAQVKEYYRQNMAYLQQTFLPGVQTLPGCLYNGSAGMAVTLAAGIRAGWLEDSEAQRAAVLDCLQQAPIGLDVANGAAGQGMALLQCRAYLPEQFVQSRLQELANLLLVSQQKDGAWIVVPAGSQKGVKITGWATGVSGIACFLLQLATACQVAPAKAAAVKALHWLQQQGSKHGHAYTWPVHAGSSQVSPGVHKGGGGIALAFIKAYEYLQDPVYKHMAEGALNSYPPHVCSRDLSQAHGLAGLGEVYLEAWRVLGNEEWKDRAGWIANTLLQLRKQTVDGGSYWLPDAICSPPTADLMTGNSGIVHFLARYLSSQILHYPLL